MKRRQFITNTSLTAIAISTTGFISFNGKSYDGNCETTTDILGPFYRPDSPVRNNLVIPGSSGLLVELSGTIKHNDCITPYKNVNMTGLSEDDTCNKIEGCDEPDPGKQIFERDQRFRTCDGCHHHPK